TTATGSNTKEEEPDWLSVATRRSSALAGLFRDGWRNAVLQRRAAAGQARVLHEVLMRVECLFAGLERHPLPGAVGLQRPALLIVPEVGDHDLVKHLLMDGLVEYWHQRLDPVVQVPWHQVGGRDVYPGAWMGQPVAGTEAIDPRMLEEPADDALHADTLRQVGQPGPQAADAPDDHVDLDSFAAGPVERVDDLRIYHGIVLDPDL